MIRFFVTIILGAVAIVSVIYTVGLLWAGWEVSKAMEASKARQERPVRKQQQSYPKTKNEVKKFVDTYRSQDRGFIQ